MNQHKYKFIFPLSHRELLVELLRASKNYMMLSNKIHTVGYDVYIIKDDYHVDYPLVNCYIIGTSPLLYRWINDFCQWDMFDSKLWVYQRVNRLVKNACLESATDITWLHPVTSLGTTIQWWTEGAVEGASIWGMNLFPKRFPQGEPAGHGATNGVSQLHRWLVGGLEHFWFSHMLGITIPIDQYLSEG